MFRVMLIAILLAATACGSSPTEPVKQPPTSRGTNPYQIDCNNIDPKINIINYYNCPRP